jgi:hypothetical protein
MFEISLRKSAVPIYANREPSMPKTNRIRESILTEKEIERIRESILTEKEIEIVPVRDKIMDQLDIAEDNILEITDEEQD